MAEKQNVINQVNADYDQVKSEQRTKVETVISEVQKIIDRSVYNNVYVEMMGFQQLIHLSPVIPANLFVLCPNLQKMESVQGKTVLLCAVDTVVKYNACKACHGAIVKALR